MIDPQDDEPIQEQPNVAAIAVIGLMVGMVLWLGGACLILGSGDDPVPTQRSPATVATPRSAVATATRLPHRTDCAAIRGTEYQSEAERQWFLVNCA